ncbi:hypothetical protein pdam_00009775 [Pocillopora damicornis]|uniref:Alkylated DNA repair protein AlkB homologue 8 N-terminal domain-containing protein n=1 Tax=Pocillopora damicornis TaxID=46731 RepID=A0A3M6V0N5_POCDA|nr:hypothetical protein pdam_00009775 [Pocillopora damicornis]
MCIWQHNISAKYLKIAAPHISGTLTKIFNQSGGQRQNAIITDQYLCFRVFLRYMNLLQIRPLLIMHKKLKSEAILIGSKHAVKNAPDLQIIMDGRLLKQCEDFKYLGVYIDNTLSWNKHITYLASRIYPKLKMLNRIAPFLSQRVLLNIYKQTILPIVDYGCIVWGDCGKNNSQRLERLQNQAMRTILSTNRNTCSQEMRSKLSLLSLESRRRFLRLNLRSAFHTRDFRDSTLLNIVVTKTKMGQTSFKCTAAREWNLLPKDIREIQSLSKFKAILFEYFLEHDKSNHLCSTWILFSASQILLCVFAAVPSVPGYEHLFNFTKLAKYGKNAQRQLDETGRFPI